MPVSVTFECGGCFRKEPGTGFVRNNFRSFSGRSHGFGVYKEMSVTEVAPDGWVVFDPYTQCTYCPDCWASIERGTDEATT